MLILKYLTCLAVLFVMHCVALKPCSDFSSSWQLDGKNSRFPSLPERFQNASLKEICAHLSDSVSPTLFFIHCLDNFSGLYPSSVDNFSGLENVYYF